MLRCSISSHAVQKFKWHGLRQQRIAGCAGKGATRLLSSGINPRTSKRRSVHEPASPDHPSTEEDSAAALFRLRDFRLYISGRFLGTLAMMIQSVAVGWQVYDMTESAMALGMVGLAQFLPMVLITLPAGDIADRIDRRLIVAASALLEAGAAAWLIALSLLGTTEVLWFYAALALFGTGRAFMAPASRSFVPIIVSKLQLPRAIAVSSSSFQISVIAGPALGGFLYIFGPVAAWYGAGELSRRCRRFPGDENAPRAAAGRTRRHGTASLTADFLHAPHAHRLRRRSRSTSSRCCLAARRRCCRSLRATFWRSGQARRHARHAGRGRHRRQPVADLAADPRARATSCLPASRCSALRPSSSGCRAISD